MTAQQPEPTAFGKVKQTFRAAQGTLEVIAKGIIVLFVLGSMFLFGKAADPALAHPERKIEFADRILSWSFVVFSVGLAELFVLFVVLSVLGKIDLAAAFRDKEPGAETEPQTQQSDGSAPAAETDDATATTVAARKAPRKRGSEPTPSVSLSRLQAFMWTLVVMTVYFHRVVKDENNGLPAIPAELLMVMGISGATYLVSKSISSSKPKPEGGG